MIPSFISVGAVAAGIGNVTPGLPPDYRDDDIFLLLCETFGQAVATPAGWASVANSPQNHATTRLSAFWKRVSGAQTAPTITDPGDHCVAQIANFRGCATSGDPWDVTAGTVDAVSNTVVAAPGLTTTAADCLVVLCAAVGTDVATAQFSAWANAGLANLLERLDSFSTQGGGGGLAMATGEKAAAGVVAATAATLATAGAKALLTIALKPEPAQGGGPTYTALPSRVVDVDTGEVYANATVAKYCQPNPAKLAPVYMPS